ncbi:Checkpoint kinase 2 [Mortierella sp. AM989]|nr:Checkpoint kinase 2 [Mortierella sp. AM989]
MEPTPPPPPPSSQFLMPRAPARPRNSATGSTSEAGSSNVQATSYANVDATNISLSQEGVIFYQRPDITASQMMMPTQPTQLIDTADELDQEDNKGKEKEVPFQMIGHNSTMTPDLAPGKEFYTFGTSDANCDVLINHRHWDRIMGETVPEPIFQIVVTRSNTTGRVTKFGIEFIGNSNQYNMTINDKPLKRYARKPISWGETIKATFEGQELFRYTFKHNEKASIDTLQGEYSMYTLEGGPIASGSYAQVYRAIDNATGEIYACKCVDYTKKDYSEQEKGNIGFEIDMLKSLRNEHIVKFKDVCQQNQKTYIFTEFIEGYTLQDHYREHRNYFSEVDTRYIFVQICKAIHYLHGLGIVHRDIKSENIMITPTKSDLKVTLIDFGTLVICSARRDKHFRVIYNPLTKYNLQFMIDLGIARSSSASSVLTTYCGTPAYMAPEAHLGNEKNGYGLAVDIWSLGVLLFRMLVGSYPFEGKRPKVKTFIPEEARRSNPDQPTDQAGAEEETESNQDYEYYHKSWKNLVNRQYPRSPDEHMLELDPSRRIKIDAVLRHDWIRMIDDELQKYDNAEHHPTVVIDNSSNLSENDIPNQMAVWGELNISKGCIPDAPRYIYLSAAKTWMGRDRSRVSVCLGKDRSIGSVHCLIIRRDDGEVMVSNSDSHNGTYINGMKIEIGRAVQLLDGDELGIIVPPENRDQGIRFPVSYRLALRYKVTIYGVVKTTKEILAKRKYVDFRTPMPRASIKAKSNRGEGSTVPPPKADRIWGKLRPLNEYSKKENLTRSKTSIGRDRGEDCYCIIEWDEDHGIATISSTSINGVSINGSKIRGRFQLRHNDTIVLVGKVVEHKDYIGYKFEIPEAMPGFKRFKEEAGVTASSSSSTGSSSGGVRSESPDTTRPESPDLIRAATPTE